MGNQLFRKASMDRVSSPEQLQDYMRVTSPGIWMVLSVVIVLLAGLIACSALGRIDTVEPARAVAQAGKVTVSLESDSKAVLKEGMALRIAGEEVPLEYVYQTKTGEKMATATVSVPDGNYDVQVVTESISPITFLTN